PPSAKTIVAAWAGSCAMSYMRALASTIGLKAGWAVTSGTGSPSIQTSRPSRNPARYSSPVRIICALRQYFLVDDVFAVGLAVEDREDVLHRDDRHAVDRLARHPGDVRGSDEVGQGQERILLRRRRLDEDVER